MPFVASPPTGTFILSGSLALLNRQKSIGFPPDWNCTEQPWLWVYNLHYHEFL